MHATNHACCLNHVAGHAKLVQQIIKVPAKAVDIFGKTSERDRVVTVFFEDTTPAPRPIAIINRGRHVKPGERAAFGRSTLWIYAENDPWNGSKPMVTRN